MYVIMDINVSGVKPITYPVYYRYKDDDYGYYCTKYEEHPVYRYDNYCSICGSIVSCDKDKVLKLEDLHKTYTITKFVDLVNIINGQDDLTLNEGFNYHTYIDYDKLDKDLINNLDKVINIFKDNGKPLDENGWTLSLFDGSYEIIKLPKKDYYSVPNLMNDLPVAVKNAKSTITRRNKDTIRLLKMFFDKVDIAFKVTVL